MMRGLVLGAALALAIGPAIAEPNKPILDRAQHYQADALKLLERLVNIDSGTGYADGLVQVGAIAVEELRKLGADDRNPSRPGPRWATTSSPRFTGTGKGRILLMAHTDTVFAQGHRGDAAVPHRRRARLRAGRVRRQGRHRHRDFRAENPAGPEIQGLRAHHAASQHQRGNRLARHPRADREACQGARRHAQSRSRPCGRRHRDLAQGLGAAHHRGEGPRRARRRLAGAGPQRGDGTGATRCCRWPSSATRRSRPR